MESSRRASYERWLEESKTNWAEDFEALLRKENAEACQMIWGYICLITKKSLASVVDDPGEISPAIRSATMTLSEQVKEMFMDVARAEIEAKAEAKGRAETLLKLAFLKFGPLSDDVTKRIETASIEELDRYTTNILSASRVEDIFG